MRIAKSVIARRAAEPSVSSPWVPATAASIASQVDRSPRVAAPRSASIVLSPRARAGRALGLDPLLVEDPLHERALVVRVVDDEVAADADRLAVAAQDAGTERVERAGLHVAAGLLADQGDDPLAQLPGGPIREGDREDLPGRDATDADEIGHPMGEHTRLARPGAGQDEQRPVGRRDGPCLLRVEVAGDPRGEGLGRGDPLGGARGGRRDGRLGWERRLVREERRLGGQGRLTTEVEPGLVWFGRGTVERDVGGRREVADGVGRCVRGGLPRGVEGGLRGGGFGSFGSAGWHGFDCIGARSPAAQPAPVPSPASSRPPRASAPREQPPPARVRPREPPSPSGRRYRDHDCREHKAIAQGSELPGLTTFVSSPLLGGRVLPG